MLVTLAIVTAASAEKPKAKAERIGNSGAAAAINESALRGHIRFLADDLLEGRGPGTRGDALTQLYLASQFQSLGLQPAADEGRWRQPVPLVGIKTQCPETITFRGGSQPVELDYYDDYIATAGRPEETTRVDDAELVFVGYGIQAPEYDWDDFEDVDVEGKILLILNNDPADDPDLFAGRRRLYYGRWDYKYHQAAKMGAAGAIIIHTTESAGYPFQVVQTSWSSEEFELRSSQGPRCDVHGWVTGRAARRIVTAAGNDLDSLRSAAQSRDFRPVPLGVTTSIELRAAVREIDTANVLARLPGRDPALRDQAVVFMAHHDHMGVATQRQPGGDQIYNGAVDNASGTAALLTFARAFAELPEPPRRSILFAAVGAEESGLLGSKHLAADPPIAPGNMAAVINIDGVNIIGPTHDVNMIGMGKSTLDDVVRDVAESQGRIVTPDQFPDRGYYYRSDQFSLARIGVPGVYLHSGVHVVGKPDEWGRRQLERWIDETYHQPSDEYDPDWNLDGAIRDIRLLYRVGRRLAEKDELPAWNPGDEFEAARKRALRAAGDAQ